MELRRNYGQTAAMSAGIEHAAGEIIVTIDGDCKMTPPISRCLSLKSTKATTWSMAGEKIGKTLGSLANFRRISPIA